MDMDGTPQPDTTPAPPEAEVVVPGEPVPEAPSGPPPDPWALPEMTEEQLARAAVSVGMAPGEFQAHFSPAKEVHDTFHVEPLMNMLDEAGLINPADGIRALGQLGSDVRMWRQAHAAMLADLPKGASVNVAPLVGAALERAIDEVTYQYLPAAYGRMKAHGILESQIFRDTEIRSR